MKRAICHEAGHAVAALYLGFCVQRIEVIHGFPQLNCELDSPQKTQEDRCIVLAGGIASEKFSFGCYDQEASRGDQSLISERGGGFIEDYLPQALEIMRSNEGCLLRLRKRLTRAWLEESAAASFGSDANSFELLSRQDIERIWEARENND